MASSRYWLMQQFASETTYTIVMLSFSDVETYP